MSPHTAEAWPCPTSYYIKIRNERSCCLRLVGLDQDGVRLQLLDELLGALGQHGRLVGRANQIDLLTVEALGQVDQGRVEAVLSKVQGTRSGFKIINSRNHRSSEKLNNLLYLPIAHSIVETGVEVSSACEDVAGEGGAIVGSKHPLVGCPVPVDSICHFLKSPFSLDDNYII